MASKVKQIAKLINVGKHGVTAYLGGEYRSTISGYVGHNWTDDTDETTVIVDSRGMSVEQLCALHVRGPMPQVDLPDGTMQLCFEDGTRPYSAGEARSLDYIALDVYCRLAEDAGAVLYRGSDAVAFVATISKPRG